VKDREYIISIGRPSYQKNPLLMVEIMKRVHEHYPKVKFYLVGVGFYSPMLDEMKALISKYVLEDVICLVPWVDHKMTLGYLKKSSLYLSTSLYEGLPIAVLEALAMGKAIVLSDVLGNKDCVKSGVNGFLIPLNESDVAEAFSKRILFLLENEEERKKMERESLEYFQSDFCIANRIQDLERIYKEIKG
jgi:glycosyltransferase involved in cell wall biosynthesis